MASQLGELGNATHYYATPPLRTRLPLPQGTADTLLYGAFANIWRPLPGALQKARFSAVAVQIAAYGLPPDRRKATGISFKSLASRSLRAPRDAWHLLCLESTLHDSN
jgi:hypothetical protein